MKHTEIMESIIVTAATGMASGVYDVAVAHCVLRADRTGVLQDHYPANDVKLQQQRLTSLPTVK